MRRSGWILSLLISLFIVSNVCAALVGERQVATIDIVNTTVNYPGNLSGSEEYDAPAGLAILEYQAIERGKFGNSGYSFSTVGNQSVYVDDRTMEQKFKRVYDFIKEENKDSYKERIDILKEDAANYSRITASTHSKLITNWHCNHAGTELDKKGGGLNLAVNLTLIRGITTGNIDAILDKIIEAIRRGAKPEEVKLEI